MKTNRALTDGTPVRSLDRNELRQIEGGAGPLLIFAAGALAGAAAFASGYLGAQTVDRKSNEANLTETIRKTLEEGGM